MARVRVKSLHFDRDTEVLEMRETLGRRLGTAVGSAVGSGVEAIVDGFAKIGRDLQLDVLAEEALDGAAAAGETAVEGWLDWHDVQPVTSTAVTTAALATTALVAFAGKRGLMLAFTGSAVAGTLLLPVLLVELLQAEEAIRGREHADA
jgi:hypothetical protein